MTTTPTVTYTCLSASCTYPGVLVLWGLVVAAIALACLSAYLIHREFQAELERRNQDMERRVSEWFARYAPEYQSEEEESETV